MVLKRLGARHVRAATWATRAARQLCPILATGGAAPAGSAPALACSFLTNDYATGTRLSHTSTHGAGRVYNGPQTHASAIRQLRSISTLAAWSERLRELDGPFMSDLAFWDEAFALAKAKFHIQGIYATFHVFVGSGYAPSETISLYRSQHFPQEFLPQSRHVETYQLPAIEAFQGDPIAAELSYLKALCSYVQLEGSRFGRLPPVKANVYRRILSRVLLVAPEQLPQFHNLLSSLSPSKGDIIEFIVANGKFPQQQAALQKFCFALPEPLDTYDEIIQPLCLSRSFPAALSWHKFLFRQGKRPQDPTVLEPLIAYLNQSKQRHEARKLEQLRKDSTTSEMQAIATSIEQHFPQGRIRRSEWSDEKSARLYATRFLSLNAVVSSLELFSVKELGPSSIREILLRCSNGSEVDNAELRSHFELLKRADIAITSSVYGRLAQTLLEEGDMSSLYQLATNNVHPDEFDDPNILTSIFAQLDQSDAQQWNLIRKALLVDTTKENEDFATLNLLLRRSLLRDDHEGSRRVLEKMQEAHIPATDATLQLMYQKFMGKQQHNFDTVRSLSQVQQFSKLLSSLMKGGLFVPPAYWDDILRSMLLLGALDAHEKLCINIAGWYQERKHQRKGEVEKVLHPMPTSGQRSVLFRPQCVNEIIMYYMYHGQSSTDSKDRISKSQPTKIRAGILASHPVLRGLRLLLHLRAVGIDIGIEVIQSVLRTRMWIVCRQGCKLASGVVVKRLDNVLERDYHLAAEILIGARDPVLQNMRYMGEREVKKPVGKPSHNLFDEDDQHGNEDDFDTDAPNVL